MRILELNTEKTWRGGERQTIYDLLGYRMQGNESFTICRAGYPLAEHCIGNNLPFKTINNHFQLLYFLIFKSKSFDIIHCQTSKTQQLAVFTKWFHGKKVVYTRRLDFVPKGFLSIIKYKFTDCIVAITPAIQKILAATNITNTALISEVVEQKTLNRERALKLISGSDNAGKKIIGTTAAFVQHKDPLTMVKAIHKLYQLRQDFVFYHFGNGILMDETKKAIITYKLNDVYIIGGFHKNVEDVFSVLDVFVMSSEEEGLGSSVLDAFMYKVPVVSTNAGGLADVVEGNGLLSKVKDAEALAANINRILNDPELKNKLVKNAHEAALNKHSLEVISKQYSELFSKLIKAN